MNKSGLGFLQNENNPKYGLRRADVGQFFNGLVIYTDYTAILL